MATTSSIGTVGRNYATIGLWAAAFTSGGWIGQCYNDTEFLIAVTLNFSGLSTSGANFITLTTGAGQSAFDVNTNSLGYNQANGVGVRSTTAYFSIITPVSFLTINKIQFSNQGSGNSNRVINGATNSTAGGGFVVSQNILEVTAATGSNVLPLSVLGAGTITNNVIICGSASSSAVQVQYISGAIILANNTLVRTSNNTAAGTAVITSGGGAPKLVNNAIFGFSAISSGTTPTGSNNATDLSSIGFGTANQTSLTYASQFVTTTFTGRNFQTKTGANLLDNGATDTTDIPAAIDIFGTSRPQGSAWDIGAHELISSGSTVTGAGAITNSIGVAGVGATTFAGAGMITNTVAVTGVGAQTNAGKGTLTLDIGVAGVGATTFAGAGAVGLNIDVSGAGATQTVVTGAGTIGLNIDVAGFAAHTVTGVGAIGLDIALDGISQSAIPTGGLGDLPLSRKERDRLRKKAEAFLAKQEKSWQEQLAERRDLRDSIVDTINTKKGLGIPKLPEVFEDDDEEAEIEFLLLNI